MATAGLVGRPFPATDAGATGRRPHDEGPGRAREEGSRGVRPTGHDKVVGAPGRRQWPWPGAQPAGARGG